MKKWQLWVLFGLFVTVTLLLGLFLFSSKSDVTGVSLRGNVLGTDDLLPITPSRRKQCQDTSTVGVGRYVSDEVTANEIQNNIGYRNNKFGIYIYALDDYIEMAGDLVNSSGGRWGYVLLPYNTEDRDIEKWSSVFHRLREKELIPIIQLWDISPDNYYATTQEAARFLNRLDWPIRKRYISAYNEMNDARFWKGNIDPEGYAAILSDTIDIFKDFDENYFLMNGAFNSTAPTTDGYLDQVTYMERMNAAVPGIFLKLDGWASHPYPMPAYRGLPTDRGRGTIRGYEWELELLRTQFGVTDIPVFITETGWPHKQGEKDDSRYYDQETVANFIVQAYEDVWLPDPRVVAVTPFTIYYSPPHDHMAWIKEEHGHEVYPQFTAIQNLTKVSGAPPKLIFEQIKILNCE